MNADFLAEIPADVRIQRGIGLFHVHGHQNSCFSRYSPTFIPGAGNVEGEIIETLWALLNEIAGSTRSSGRFTRQDMIDAHMDYSNWRKLTGMGKNLGDSATYLTQIDFQRRHFFESSSQQFLPL